MEIAGMTITDASAQKEPYRMFVEELSGWYGGGEMPQLASQDLRRNRQCIFQDTMKKRFT